MTLETLYLDPDGGLEPLVLPRCGGLEPSVHVFDRESILAINAALASKRPLLVRGRPGTGKSQLARAAAVALGRVLLTKVVDARTESRDFFYRFDAVSRLAEAQVMGALREADEEGIRERLKESNFLYPESLWWAFEWTSAEKQAKAVGGRIPEAPKGCSADAGAVVLIDEIDKGDPSVPNGLLEALGNGTFPVPDHEPVTQQGVKPLVIVTTNEERELPDAFLRRCLVLHLELPRNRDELTAHLVQRGKAHHEACDETVLRKAAELLAEDREDVESTGRVPPGQAEFLDLLRAVTEQCEDAEDQLQLLEEIRRFALQKHPRGA